MGEGGGRYKIRRQQKSLGLFLLVYPFTFILYSNNSDENNKGEVQWWASGEE